MENRDNVKNKYLIGTAAIGILRKSFFLKTNDEGI